MLFHYRVYVKENEGVFEITENLSVVFGGNVSEKTGELFYSLFL